MKLSFDGVPVLQTERLLLREFRVEDFDNFADMWADEKVAAHISGVVSSLEESWRKMMSLAGSWSLLGFGYWNVVEKGTGQFVGIVGFGELRREIDPSIEGQPEAGWVLAQWAHGKGFVTEAMQAAMKWGLARFGEVRPVCILEPDFLPSKRVAEKCGFVDKALTTYMGNPCLIMEYQA